MRIRDQVSRTALLLGLCLSVRTSTVTAQLVEWRQLQSEAGETHFRDAVRAYVGEFELPRVLYRLQAYMNEPAALIGMTSPAIGMQVVAGTDASSPQVIEQLREWLFTQTVSMRGQESSVAMVYAGLEDGRFTGCE